MAQHAGNPGQAKTTRPRLGTVFARERLFDELDANRSASCTWVTGPPGAGKTALLASFVGERGLGCLWYQVDADDADPSAFFGALYEGARGVLGSQAAKALPPWTPDAALSLPTFARRFFRELFAVAPALMLVMDDYHEAEAALHCALHDILRAAIDQTPPEAHIAVLSRSRPPPALARAVTDGAVQLLSWQQLKLSAEEVAGIAGMHGAVLDAPAAREWLDRCGGWAAGLRLLLRRRSTAGLRLTGEEPPTVLFDYLGEEVFRKLPGSLQRQLCALALLPRIPAEAVNELADSPTAEGRLQAMAAQDLFTTVSEGGPTIYRFHPLFRDFLLHRAARELAPEALLASRLRAADALLRHGLVAEAAQVLIDGQAWGELGDLVRREAPSLMSRGRHTTLALWLAQLPPAQVQQDPWLLYWCGASRALHEPAAGQADLERAYGLFHARDDRAGLLLAWAGVVDCIFQCYADANQFGAWVDRLDLLLAADPGFPSPQVEARVTFSMFVALSFHRPHHRDLPGWRSRLAAIADAAPEPMFRLMARQQLLLGRLWSGDLCAALADLKELEREAQRRPLTPLVELVVHLAQSTLAVYSGEATNGFEAIESALLIAQASGIHIYDKILLGQGAALALGQGDLERGRSMAQRRALVARRGDAEEQSLYHAIEAWLCWQTGEHANALVHVERSVALSSRMGLPHFSAVGLLAVAIVSFECGEEEAALHQVHEGRKLGALTRNPMLLWMADLLEAYMRLRRNEDADALMRSCLALGRRHGYRHFFFWPRHAVAAVCLEALLRGIQVDAAIELAAKAQLPAPIEAMEVEAWPWPLKIFTLGRFSILVQGKPLTFETKAQRGPLNLLRALIALGGRDVAEHTLIDALWPDAAGDAGQQSLATTVSRLRKLIGAHAIKRQDGHLSLEPTLCWVDCWALEKALDGNASTSVPAALGEKIRHLYRGHFLQGNDDAPWSMHLREHLHVRVVAALNKTAQDALKHGDDELATGLWQLGLQVDDLVEDFYAGLIRCHANSGQASLAVTTYRQCQRTLAKRLGVMPSEKTTRLYLKAIEGKITGPVQDDGGAPMGPDPG